MKSKKIMALSLMVTMMASTGATTLQAIAVEKGSTIERNINNTDGKRNVMYYGDWSIWGGQGNFYPKDIPADQLTHLNFAFMDFDANGDLIFTDKDAAVGAPVGQTGVQWDAPNAGILIALQELRAENPNLKLGISVGGWSKSGDFSDVAASKTARTNFINNIVKFVEYTNMDFVDLDWEFPGEVRQADLVDNKNDEGTTKARPEDKQNYITLLEELREALNKKGMEVDKYYELTVALPAPKAKVDNGIDVERLFNVVNFANIMTYDLRGAWDDVSGHQTGLYANSNEPLTGNNLSIDESVNYLIAQGAEPEKIVIGAAYYTRGWDNVDKGENKDLPGLFGQAKMTGKDADQTPSYGAINEAPLTNGDSGRASGCWSYRSINKLKQQYPGLKEYWDDEAKAPYLYDETTGKFFTYDNVKSIEEKAKYVKENNLGGMIGWMASQDAPTSGSKRDELTNATKKALFGNEKLPANEIVSSELDVEAVVTTYEQQWGADRTGYEITIKNNEKSEENNSVLKAVERSAETIKAPKLYIKTDKALNRGDYTSGTVTYENGYTVVDLKSVWEGKNIEQGQSYTFKLSGDAKIESIEIVQRMSDDSPEMYRQTIYGETDGNEVPGVNSAPVINGVSDKTINVSEEFDALEGVSASDKEDGDLTDEIEVLGSVNTEEAGIYSLTYSVSDSEGLNTTKIRKITVQENIVTPPEEDNSDFGVGQGIEWPSQVNTPYADMTAWNNGEFSNNGALNLKKIYDDTGVKFFNLGFIQSTGGISNGKVNWGWGGFDVLSERYADNSQYQGIKKSIRDIRDIGGDVTISLGGLNGVAIWEATQDVDILYNTYKEIVEGYGLTRLDLDIEGGSATNKAHNIENAKAIKKVQDETGVDVVLTLAVLPSGLTQVQLDVLEAYLSQGVDVELVNIMTMCYGPSTLLPGENYGTASLRAVDSTKDQLKEYFKKYADINLSDAQAYRKIGTTPSVGFEGEAHPIFTAEWTELVVNHAIDRKIGMTSMWCINRDSMAQSNKGIVSPYEHTSLFKKFGANDEEIPEENSAPVIRGISDKTIKVSEEFDVLEGVSASDKEDGDLTDKIEVSGTVDINTAGKYELIYTVSDSEGLKATAKRTITVKADEVVEPEENSAPVLYGVLNKSIKFSEAFDALEGISASDKEDGDLTDKIEVSGTVDTNTAGKYELIYTVSDSEGLKATAKRTITVEEEDILEPDEENTYDSTKVYLGGETVIYNGEKYTAKWWTQGDTPGKSDVWEKEIIPNEDGSVNWYEGITCVGGDIVVYKGKLYEAKWWTQSIPGTDDSWKLVG